LLGANQADAAFTIDQIEGFVDEDPAVQRLA